MSYFGIDNLNYDLLLIPQEESDCLFGAYALLTLVLSRSRPKPSTAAQWIDAALGAIRKELPAPTIITRKVHLLAASMSDAFAAFDASLKGAYRDLKLRGISSSETSASDQEFAIAHAAHKSLRRLFPDQRKSFRSLLKDQGFDDRDDASEKLGSKAARSVLKARKEYQK